MRRPLPLFALALPIVPLSAQTHHVAPPEKVTRAVAVYEYTGTLDKPTASRLVPVSLFINGRLEDAGLFMARPVPFALAPGNLYFIERAGEEEGTLAIAHARDFTTGRLLPDQDPLGAWYGFGTFQPLAPPKPAPALHASSHPSAISVSNDDPNRPHLNSKADTSVPSAPADTDRPTLSRHDASRSGSTDSADSQASSQTTTASSGDAGTSGKSTDVDPERPSLRRRSPENVGKKSPPQAGVTGPERSLNDDPDRPVIRHGKTPTQEDAEELKTVSADMHQVAAVSDPANREPHTFARAWDSATERADVLGHTQALARAQVSTYLTQNHLTPGAAPVAKAVPATPISSTPTSPATSPTEGSAPRLRRMPNGVNTSTGQASSSTVTPSGTPAPVAPKTAYAKAAAASPSHTSVRARNAATKVKPAPAAPIVLADEHLGGYLLTYGGLPTFVYTAEVPTTAGTPVYATVVVQRLPSGELQTALASVTDAAHLDRTPWLRPIDAVDPDASHRGSLLFELRAQSSRQFALYRLVTAEADQQFVTSPID